jgi:DNA-binding XRE family transcriptional regulator
MKTKERINILLNYLTKVDLAQEIGITRPTLDSRIEKDNWKKGEEIIVKEIFKNKIK